MYQHARFLLVLDTLASLVLHFIRHSKSTHPTVADRLCTHPTPTTTTTHSATTRRQHSIISRRHTGIGWQPAQKLQRRTV